MSLGGGVSVEGSVEQQGGASLYPELRKSPGSEVREAAEKAQNQAVADNLDGVRSDQGPDGVLQALAHGGQSANGASPSQEALMEAAADFGANTQASNSEVLQKKPGLQGRTPSVDASRTHEEFLALRDQRMRERAAAAQTGPRPGVAGETTGRVPTDTTERDQEWDRQMKERREQVMQQREKEEQEKAATAQQNETSQDKRPYDPLVPYDDAPEDSGQHLPGALGEPNDGAPAIEKIQNQQAGAREGIPGDTTGRESTDTSASDSERATQREQMRDQAMQRWVTENRDRAEAMVQNGEDGTGEVREYLEKVKAEENAEVQRHDASLTPREDVRKDPRIHDPFDLHFDDYNEHSESGRVPTRLAGTQFVDRMNNRMERQAEKERRSADSVTEVQESSSVDDTVQTEGETIPLTPEQQMAKQLQEFGIDASIAADPAFQETYKNALKRFERSSTGKLNIRDVVGQALKDRSFQYVHASRVAAGVAKEALVQQVQEYSPVDQLQRFGIDEQTASDSEYQQIYREMLDAAEKNAQNKKVGKIRRHDAAVIDMRQIARDAEKTYRWRKQDFAEIARKRQEEAAANDFPGLEPEAVRPVSSASETSPKTDAGDDALRSAMFGTEEPVSQPVESPESADNSSSDPDEAFRMTLSEDAPSAPEDTTAKAGTGTVSEITNPATFSGESPRSQRREADSISGEENSESEVSSGVEQKLDPMDQLLRTDFDAVVRLAQEGNKEAIDALARAARTGISGENASQSVTNEAPAAETRTEASQAEKPQAAQKAETQAPQVESTTENGLTPEQRIQELEKQLAELKANGGEVAKYLKEIMPGLQKMLQEAALNESDAAKKASLREILGMIALLIPLLGAEAAAESGLASVSGR